MDTERKYKISTKLYHKKWKDNTSRVAKTIVLIELITVLERRGRNIWNEKIRIEFNNKNITRR